MQIEFRKAEPGDAAIAVELLAETMADFGVAALGLGNCDLELKALRTWYVQTGNRFSHEFAWLAFMNGEIAGLLLTLHGNRLGKLERAMASGIFSIYRPAQVIKLLYRFMFLARTEEAEKDEYLVSHLAVAPAFRRMGIATTLLQKAEFEAREAGYDKLVLEVEIGNEAAIKCYEKFGFRNVMTSEFKERAGILSCPGYHKMLKTV